TTLMIGGVAVASSAAATTTPPGTDAPAGSEAAIDLSGTTVTLFGIEGGATEGPALQVALNAFDDDTAMTITYSGSRGFEGEVGTMIEGGSPPDIGMFPQPGRIG